VAEAQAFGDLGARDVNARFLDSLRMRVLWSDCLANLEMDQVRMTEPNTLDPDTLVYGIFECEKCHEVRPILSPRKSRGGPRVYHCRHCKARGDVHWLSQAITLEYYENNFTGGQPR